jgi:arylsulfatase A-like enzyme
MPDEQTNLVYVFADQLRFDAIGCNGSPIAKTPNIDALSSRCLNLDNAVSGHPVCAPYRASLFTGKYTTSTGMVINEIRMNPNHRCFAHVLNDAGYETCYIGKWHLYAAQLGNHYDPKNSFIPKGPDRLGFDDCFAAYNFHHEYYAPNAYYHLDTPEKIYADGYEPTGMTDFAIDQLTRLSKGSKPFALFLSLGTPHDPWVPENVPPEYLEKFADAHIDLPPNYRGKNDPYADMWARFKRNERKALIDWMRVYHAMVAELDANVGKIAAALTSLGLDENTIFIFTSDHGEMFGAQGRRAKNIFYEEAVKVPFLMKWGSRLPKGRADFCFNTVDIMPSLLTLMGLSYPVEVEGLDLSKCLSGEADNEKGSLLMGTGPTAIFVNGYEWRAVRDKRYTYAVYLRDMNEFLFDRADDPHQMNNLAHNPDFQRIKDELRQDMYNQMAAINDGFWSNLEYRRHWIKNRIIKKTATLA